MFELPRPIQTQDNTGALLMKAAEEARLQQQQLSQLVQKNEQIRQEAFGGAQKQLFDISSAQNVPAEVQRQILSQGMDKLTKLYKDRQNVRSGDIAMLAMDTLVKAKNDATAYQQYLGNSEKFIADLKEKGFDEFNLKTAISNSIFDEKVVQTPNGQQQMVRVPKDPTKLGDPLQFLAKEVDGNPQKYLNREKSSQALTKLVGDYKPGELTFSDTKDLTGKKTVKVSYTEKSYPWTRTQEQNQNGIPVKINVLDTEPEDIGGQQVQILSKKAYDYFANNPNPTIVKEVDAMGRDYIDDHNRNLGINPQQITADNFDKVAAQFPGAINPFDNGNRMIFSRLALTKTLQPTFGRFGNPSVTIDAAKPNVTNVYNNDLYTRTGNLRPEARFPTSWAQIVNQDADVMRVSDEVSFQFDGKTLSGKKTGDRAQGQIIKDNGKRATVLSRPEEPGVIYVAELEDGEITDNVIKLSGKEAVDYGAKISSANGSDIKTFGKLYPNATKTVVPMSDADKATVADNLSLQSEREEGKALVGAASQIRALKDGETKNVNNARVSLNGKEVVIKSITRKNTGWFTDSPVEVTLKDGSKVTFANKEEFIKTLIDSNK